MWLYWQFQKQICSSKGLRRIIKVHNKHYSYLILKTTTKKLKIVVFCILLDVLVDVFCRIHFYYFVLVLLLKKINKYVQCTLYIEKGINQHTRFRKIKSLK